MSSTPDFTSDDIVSVVSTESPIDTTADILWCVSKVCGFIGESFIAVSNAAHKY